jgi:hypothetical protein
MGKAGKIILGLVVGVVAVVAILMVGIFQNLDGIIKQVIEGAGTQATGVAVRVADVKFTLQEGRGEIRGLTIANPPGYQSGNLFEMDEIAVQVELASLTGPVIVINEVLIDGARLIAEQKGTTTNVQELMDGMQSGASEPAPEAGEAGDVRLMLEQFAFLNSDSTLKTQQFGEKDLKLPDIRLSDMGDRETGLTPEQLAGQVLGAVVKQVEKAVAKYLEDMVKGAAKDEINKQIDEKLGAENREKLEGLKGMFKKKE